MIILSPFFSTLLAVTGTGGPPVPPDITYHIYLGGLQRKRVPKTTFKMPNDGVLKIKSYADVLCGGPLAPAPWNVAVESL